MFVSQSSIHEQHQSIISQSSVREQCLCKLLTVMCRLVGSRRSSASCKLHACPLSTYSPHSNTWCWKELVLSIMCTSWTSPSACISGLQFNTAVLQVKRQLSVHLALAFLAGLVLSQTPDRSQACINNIDYNALQHSKIKQMTFISWYCCAQAHCSQCADLCLRPEAKVLSLECITAHNLDILMSKLLCLNICCPYRDTQNKSAWL